MRRQTRWPASVWGLLVLTLLPLRARAQQGNVLLEKNEQLFCVLAALNSAGYDTGFNPGPLESARAEVRAAEASKSISVVPDLRKFYEVHRIRDDPGADLGQFVSLSLLLGPPPDFHFTVSALDLPPDAHDVSGLVPLLKDFYRQGHLQELWARMQPRYQAMLNRYSAPVRRTIAETDAYLRFPSGAYLGRTYVIYVDLLGAPEQVQARIYGDHYYLVITPSRELKLDEIRHQYMHFLLDPLAAKYAPQIERLSSLQAIARKAPALDKDFQEDFPLLVTECLIGAAEVRMDKLLKVQAQRKVQALTASGLILVPYFYQALAKFERRGVSMDVAYEPMILGIDPALIAKQLADVKFAPPAAPPAVKPEISEQERLLEDGDNAIYQGRYEQARAAFEEVLQKYNAKNQRALFGIAVAESNLRKPDIATEYFKRTLASAHDLWIITWSHIYLGRIDDLMGERRKALAEYRAASLTAAAFPEATRAVQAGLQKPFGAKR